MKISLAWIRYFLLIVTAISGLYLCDIHSNSEYIFNVLLVFCIVKARYYHLFYKLKPLMILLEISFITFCVQQYNGPLYIWYVSAAIALFEPTLKGRKWFYLLCLIIAMDYELIYHDTHDFLLFQLFIGTTLFLLRLNEQTSLRHNESEALYDELSRKHYELDEARKRLLDYAIKIEDFAQVEERNRISKDIHDDLGHQLIRLKMMMEASLQIYSTNPDKSKEFMEQTRDQLGESMEKLRRTLRRMAPDEEMVHSYSISRLVEQIVKENGILVTLSISGIPTSIYPSLEIALFRNTQEAITNAIRHGSASEIQIKLCYDTEWIQLIVSNNGEIPLPIERKGLGLRGMYERIALLGGSIVIDYSPQFSITTLLPCQHSDLKGN